MLKIPEVFLKSLEDITIQNENEVASKIALELNSNNISTFTYLINEETNLNIDDIMKKIKLPIKNIETNIILKALIQYKNDKLKHGIYTEPIDELILKLNKIY